MRSKVMRCGKCQEFIDYPPFKVPLGPPTYEPDELAESYGLDVRNGIVKYSSFCLPCTRAWVEDKDEDFFRDADQLES